jgi:putative peptide zinc metalloprotease protein
LVALSARAMTGTLFSSNWYRVAALRPRLRGHVEAHRHLYRGQRWYVLQDHASGQFHRFSPAAHLLIGQMDGSRTVQEMWDDASRRLGDDLPTQDEVIQLLAQLHSADLMQTDVPPDVVELSHRSERHRRRALVQSIRNPLAVKLPLFDPDRFLSATLAAVRPLFAPSGFALWLAFVAFAAIEAGIHWSALTEGVIDRVLTTGNMFLLVVTYPLIKALHELGHGYAAKRWGGEVHELGVMLLVFIPVPYVDASSSSAFRSKWQRAVVGGAGIMVELLLASVALLLWLELEPGFARACVFNVMLIAGVSTLLFNGNPLLRYDGYYVLADLIEIPNLATRANKFLLYVVQRHLFGVESLESPATARGEAGWFAAYGVAAFVYRAFITALIVGFVASKFMIIGVLLAVWAVVLMFGVPLAKGAWFLIASPVLRRRRRRACAVTGAAVAAAAAAVFALPIPHSTIAQGVVWLPDGALVRAGTDGFIEEVARQSGDHVAAGDAVVRLISPTLTAQVNIAEAQLKELELRYAALDFADLVQADVVREQISHARANLGMARERAAELQVRSPVDGALVLSDASDLAGRYARKGEVLGQVLKPGDAVVRAVVGQDDSDLVRQRTRRVDVRFASDWSNVVAARFVREVPSAQDELPSLALSKAAGGPFALDPTKSGRAATVEKVFQFELSMPIAPHRFGDRVYVRFDHGDEAIASRLYRRVRQLFLRHFVV